jgi:hypothetical protein
MAFGNKAILSVESLDERVTPSGGVTPANGREFGTGTIDLLRELRADGQNLGDICSVEKGECATDSLEFLQPPGHR